VQPQRTAGVVIVLVNLAGTPDTAAAGIQTIIPGILVMIPGVPAMTMVQEHLAIVDLTQLTTITGRVAAVTILLQIVLHQIPVDHQNLAEDQLKRGYSGE
jgi:ethanolamine utilization microcompartment shell protein EutS